ncbi:polysaccharide deacetylase [Clostridiales bacterium oral taxon 876 str. F0540]|nr:polysaccharide deacetylase [Clostridiales bacterium oral taxon 876 str. F0540]
MKRLKKKRIAVLLIAVIFLVGASFFAINKGKKDNVLKAQTSGKTQEELKAESEKKKQQEDEAKKEELKKQEQLKFDKIKALKEDPQQQQAVKGIGKSKNIPILMYHSIDYEKGNELRIPKDKFREQMKYLKDNGYTPLSLDELYSHMVYGTKVPEKPVVITLDDGYSDNYTNAYPVLKEFGFKAVIFVITNTVADGGSYLNAEQIKEMDKNGIDIESHTVSHPRLNELSYDKQVNEMKESKEYLEKLLNKDINYIAYPYGNFNENTLKAVEEIGYKMAVSTKSGLASKANGIYKLHRIYISNNYDMEKFKRLVKGM